MRNAARKHSSIYGFLSDLCADLLSDLCDLRFCLRTTHKSYTAESAEETRAEGAEKLGRLGLARLFLGNAQRLSDRGRHPANFLGVSGILLPGEPGHGR